MIDCHAHVWNPADGYPWIRPGSPHHRAYRVADLARSGAGLDVTGTVLVEASRGDAGETDTLRAARTAHPGTVAGYVGNLHVYGDAGPDRFRALLDDLADDRPNGMRLGGRTWSATPEPARALLDVLAEYGMALDLNLGAGALRTAADVADRYPGLTVVVDHLGNPGNLTTDDPSDWLRDLAYAAGRAGVVVKISGLLTQQRGVPAGRVVELVRRVVDAVGPDRCVLGSDWPICLPAGSRAEALRLAGSGLAGLTAAERERVRHDTAVRVYRLRRLTTLTRPC